MEKIFLSLLEMSMIGSYVAISVMIARVFLKKSPQVFSYLLWSVVFFRFLCPFTLESDLSLLPQQTQQMSQNFELFYLEEFYVTQSREKVVDSEQTTQNSMESTEIEAEETKNSGINSEKISKTEFFMMIWFSGVLILTLYSITSLWKMKRTLKSAICYEDNIYFTDKTDSPFVFGLWKPHIYIPSNATEEELSYIIAHENCHIRRFDHITRLICLMTVILHWFNPLVWCSYYLSERDMELCCDESVLLKKTVKNRGEYARILLKFSENGNLITPLAFSKSNLKGRVKNIMKMKNTKLWVSGVSAVLVLGLVVGFSTNTNQRQTPMASEPFHCVEQLEQVWRATIYHFHDARTVSYDNIEKEGIKETQFHELMDIFQKYTFTPANYKEFASSGGGINERTGKFDVSIFFAYDTTDPMEYRGHSYELRFFTDQDNFVEIKIFENGRGVISIGSDDFSYYNKPLEEQIVILQDRLDNPIYHYSYPFYLEGSNYELFDELAEYCEIAEFVDKTAKVLSRGD